MVNGSGMGNGNGLVHENLQNLQNIGNSRTQASINLGNQNLQLPEQPIPLQNSKTTLCITLLSWNTERKAKSTIPKILKQIRRVFNHTNTAICFQETPKWGTEDGRVVGGFQLYSAINSACSIAIPVSWAATGRSRAWGQDWYGVALHSIKIIIISLNHISWDKEQSQAALGQANTLIASCHSNFW